MMRTGKVIQWIGSTVSACKFILCSLILGFCVTTSYAADTTKPTAPTALTAAVVSATQINLSWTAATDNVGVTGYRIERCAGSGCTSYAQITATTDTTFNDTGLISGATYRYRVRANDAAGNVGSYSSAITARTLDVVPPVAPINLTAAPVSGTKITLTWGAATDNVKVTGYRIERCSGGGCSNFSQVATTTTALTYSNTGLTSVVTYSYRVSAVDAAGNVSDYSNIATTTTLDSVRPVKPVGLTAYVVSNAEIDLIWTATTDNVGVAGYHIERCTGSGCTNYAEIATTAGTAFNDAGLTGSTLYRYRIRANDVAGNLSAYSSTVGATTQAGDATPPDVGPTNLIVTVASTTQLNLSWTAAHDNVGIAGYRIERCSGAGCSSFTQIATSTATTFNDTGLTQGTTYSYQVLAYDAAGNASVYSNIVDATTQSVDTSPPDPGPTNLIAGPASTSQVDLSWIAAADNIGVTGYSIERCSGYPCNFTQIAAMATLAFTDTGLTQGTTYSYRVRAYDEAGNQSEYSNTVSVTTRSLPITYTYSYDNLGRITQASGSDGSIFTYTYDANGNVTSLNRQ